MGDLASRYGCHVQTHCSESDWEHQFVIDRFGREDALVLDEFGLLGQRTVLAHGVFLGASATRVDRGARQWGSSLPDGEFLFLQCRICGSACLGARRWCGVGTDISGGRTQASCPRPNTRFLASLALDQGVDARRAAAERGVRGCAIDFKEAFWMATRGARRVLRLPIGKFAEGLFFDANVLDVGVVESNLRVWPEYDQPQDILQKAIYNGCRSNLTRQWIHGRPTKLGKGKSNPLRVGKL